ncbi:endonuclease [Streptomyces sp. NPDC051940]|uniref:endonuclease n=1 Tax=Streptomyces sp. NPDC051940 TaxID=3155675 RepID=UPI00341B6B3F
MTSAAEQRRRVGALLDTAGQTYAAEAGIRLRDTPQPLYQLLVLACLLAARIRASTAVAAARELFAAGMRDPRRMLEASRQQRVDALGRGGYRRYDERTATQLGDGARLLLDAYAGDLRNLRGQAHGDTAAVGRLLRQVPGLGPAGVDIFLREAQAVWPELVPCLDDKVLQGAHALGLPEDPGRLAALVDQDDLAALAAGLVRVSLDRRMAESLRGHSDADPAHR